MRTHRWFRRDRVTVAAMLMAVSLMAQACGTPDAGTQDLSTQEATEQTDGVAIPVRMWIAFGDIGGGGDRRS